jgi:penicillin amidase
LNPDKGYIVTANNQVVSSSYPHDLFINPDHGYRAKRIVEMIEGGGDFTIEDMMRMQSDNLSLSALEIIPYLQGLSFEEAAMQEALESMLRWEATLEMDSALAALYGYFWVALMEETLRDHLPRRLWSSDGGVIGDNSRLQSFMFSLLQDPSNPWWDDATTLDEIETRDDILRRAFEKGFTRGVEILGEDLDDWRWGDIHTVTFENQTFGRSGIGIIENIFNRGPVATSGGIHQVNRNDFSIDKPFEVDHVASTRQINDLGDLSRSLMMHPTGQSGHPGHRHYDDFIDQWRMIEYHPVRWTRDEVDDGSESRLVLKPL